MTLDDLIAKLPDQFKPWATQYGPVFLAMTADELKAWLDKLIKGDVTAAYKDVLSKMSNAELLAEWNAINADWQAANVDNVAKIELQKTALTAALKIMLAVALAAAGL